ncbi:MAG TPA: hypothetical protein VIC34_03580 [Croceibacterium sp.]|jgi:hypothetical protein
MQPLDRLKSRDSALPNRADDLPSAEIVWLEDWRRRNRQPGVPTRQRPRSRAPSARGPRHLVPIEVWLILLIVFSAIAGAIFALMGLGHLP